MRTSPRHFLALAAVLGLALVGCNGQGVFKARDANALLGTGGGGDLSGTGGMATGGGIVGTGGLGGGAGGSTGTGGGATGGTTVGTGGGAGTGTTGGVGGAATGGVGGGGGAGTGGVAGRPGAANGTPCGGSTGLMASDCSSGYCTDGVCCETACQGTCSACSKAKTVSANDGQCRPVPAGSDPDKECTTATAVSGCGVAGIGCSGAASCMLYPANTACGSTQMCSADGSGVIMGQVCNGSGTCGNQAAVSCKGFACTAAACATTCTDDTACAMGGFCSCGTCYATANLAGNGDAETNTTNGWLAANGGPALQISSPSSTPTAGYAHGGQYSIVEGSTVKGSRTYYYQGPGYNLPTGLGPYTITFYAMQADDPLFYGVPQIELKCYDSQHPSYVQLLQDFSVTMMKGVWTKVSATVDTSSTNNSNIDPGCFATAATPGLVRGAFVYLNQVTTDPSATNYDIPSPVEFPNLYIDDLVISAPVGMNLIGNPNFEAGFPDGWTATAGSPTPSVSTTFAHGGTSSLAQIGRTSPAGGITYALPLGAARYQVSMWVMQTGTMPHPLVLQPSYSCIAGTGPTATVNTTPIPLGTSDGNAAPNTWLQVSGTIVMPPANAPSGCVMAQATLTLQQTETGTCGGTVECPDLYVDDASIALK